MFHDQFQSAYRKHHSTETALIKVKSDIQEVLDKGQIMVVILLDQSSAFDIVDHDILLQRLQTEAGLCGNVLNWFRSYLSARRQCVIIGGESSDEYTLQRGVPQGSILRPRLFSVYSQPLGSLIAKYGFRYHLYADDVQLYLSFKMDAHQNELNASIKTCLDGIAGWMLDSRLCLNNEKTELAIFAPNQKASFVDKFSLTVGNLTIPAKPVIRDLGVYFDTSLTMEAHVNQVTKQCFAKLWNIGKIRRFLSSESAKTVIHATVMSRIDYGNALLCGITDSLCRRLQKIQNYAARMITGTAYRDHVTPALQSLHWLPVRSRLDYKVLVIVYQAVYGLAPSYIQELFQIYQPKRTLHSQGELKLVVPRCNTHRYGSNSFKVRSALLWNSLPVALRHSQSLPCFKRALKTHLFKIAYCL